jgi:hypothetical protein
MIFPIGISIVGQHIQVIEWIAVLLRLAKVI